MTDRALATALTQAQEIERAARASYEQSAAAKDTSEKDAALETLRHVIALRRSFEKWMSARACRAALP